MIDVGKQAQFWREGARDDWVVGNDLVERDYVRHGLFFIHLAFEKALKARVVVQTQDLAPRLHNLVRLAQLADLTLSEQQLNLLADINPFNLEGRYPDAFAVAPTRAEARAVITRAKEMFEWLNSQP